MKHLLSNYTVSKVYNISYPSEEGCHFNIKEGLCMLEIEKPVIECIESNEDGTYGKIRC